MITELSRWRAESGLTQLEAARALGVSQTYFSLLERGVRPVTDGVRRRLGAVRSARLGGQVGSSEPLGLDSGSQELQQAQALLGMLTPEKLSVVRRLLEIVAEQ